MSSLTQNFHMATTFKTVVLNWWKKKNTAKNPENQNPWATQGKIWPIQGV